MHFFLPVGRVQSKAHFGIKFVLPYRNLVGNWWRCRITCLIAEIIEIGYLFGITIKIIAISERSDCSFADPGGGLFPQESLIPGLASIILLSRA